MRVAIYARVSSERQAEKDLSIPAQLKALKRYTFSRKWDVVAEYVDEAESARSADRPAFKDMITAAKGKTKPFDVILVWKLSRFARSREDSVIYKSLLRRRQISVVSMNEQVDESPAGSLLEGIIEVIDEFYSANLSQDTMRGMKENATRGFRNGGAAPFGYKREVMHIAGVPKSTLAINDREAQIVARAFELACLGNGAKLVARILNAEGLKTRTGKTFSATGVNHILRNEVYTGTLVWNKYSKNSGSRLKREDSDVVRVPDCHPPIVNRTTFEQVRQIAASRRPSVSHPREVASQYLLSGIARCALCGSTAIGTTGKSGRFLYYTCNKRFKKGRDACGTRSMNARKLEAFVIDRIKDNILTEENLMELVKITNEQLRVDRRRCEKQLDTLEQDNKELELKLGRLYAAIESGKVDIDDLAPRLRQLRAEQSQLKERQDEALDELSLAGERRLSLKATQEYAGDLKNLLQSSSFMESKAFLRSFIRRVAFSGREVTIEYTVPVRPEKVLTGNGKVPNTGRVGSAGRIRTYDQSVNSRPLYH